MAFRSFKVDVTDIPVQVFEAQPGDLDLWIRSDNLVVFGGDDQVAVTSGFSISPDGQFHTRVRPGDELWAVRDSATTSRLHLMVRSA